MRRYVMLFVIVQLFFGSLFAGAVQLFAIPDTLQPFNSQKETVYVNLQQEARADDMLTLSRAEGLNIALYDQEHDVYYIDFSSSENPEMIYGVSSTYFTVDNFSNNMCASTNKEKNCDILLSNPLKHDLTIYPFEKLLPKTTITNILLYPNGTQTKEEIKELFIKGYPEATFTARRALTNNLLIFMVAFFVLINILILLGILQHLYKRGKFVGVQKLFGRLSFKNDFISYLTLLSSMIVILLMMYGSLSFFLTFDWSYLKYVAFYCFILIVLYSLATVFVQISLHRSSINLLIKGMRGSQKLFASFIMLNIIVLLMSGYMLAMLSLFIRQTYGQYQTFNYYQQELQLAGTIPLSTDGIPLLLQGEETFTIANESLLDEFGPYLEFKNKVLMSNPNNLEEAFTVFDVNKNFILRKMNTDTLVPLDLENVNINYIFTKNQAEHQEQIATLRNEFKEEGKETVVVEYVNDDVKEYIENQTEVGKSELNFIEVANPLYILSLDPAYYEGYPFSGTHAGGYYVALVDDEARAVWQQVPQLLEALKLTNFYREPTTIAQIEAEQLQQGNMFLSAVVMMFLLLIVGLFMLIHICLQEYFQQRRKLLVVQTIFGVSPWEKYGMLFLMLTVLFIIAWLLGSYMQNEWSGLSFGMFLVLVMTMNVLLIRQIKQLEKQAINIVIKE